MDNNLSSYSKEMVLACEAAIDAGLLRDVYVSLGEPINPDQPEGDWAVRVYYKPFVDWIWGGSVLMSLGGLLAIVSPGNMASIRLLEDLAFRRTGSMTYAPGDEVEVFRLELGRRNAD